MAVGIFSYPPVSPVGTAVGTTRQVLTGTGLSGGGNLSADRTLSLVIPVAIANGGTNATSFTAGSVFFFDGTRFQQNNANLFWDNALLALGINAAPAVGSQLYIAGTAPSTTSTASITILPNMGGGGNQYAVLSLPNITATTTSALGYYVGISTSAIAFTLANSFCFYAANATIGAGSTITNRYGFYTEAITGATNNWAIYTSGGTVQFLTGAAGVIGAIIQAAASQTADLLQIQNSAAAVLTSLNSSARFNKYNNDATVANGVSSVVGNVALTAQTLSITTATLFTPPANGTYVVTVYHVCTTTSTAGNLATTIGWTDIAAARTVKPATDISTAATNYNTGIVYIQAQSGVAITYATSLTGLVGNPQYAVYINVERLS